MNIEIDTGKLSVEVNTQRRRWIWSWFCEAHSYRPNTADLVDMFSGNRAKRELLLALRERTGWVLGALGCNLLLLLLVVKAMQFNPVTIWRVPLAAGGVEVLLLVGLAVAGLRYDRCRREVEDGWLPPMSGAGANDMRVVA